MGPRRAKGCFDYTVDPWQLQMRIAPSQPRPLHWLGHYETALMDRHWSVMVVNIIRCCRTDQWLISPLRDDSSQQETHAGMSHPITTSAVNFSSAYHTLTPVQDGGSGTSHLYPASCLPFSRWFLGWGTPTAKKIYSQLFVCRVSLGHY